MSTVTLLSPLGQSATYTLPYGETLLNLAGRLKLPLYTECRMDRCGACAVKVALVDKPGVCKVRLGEVERSILYRAGKLSREHFAADNVPAREPLWRLACQYVLGNEEVLVAL